MEFIALLVILGAAVLAQNILFSRLALRGLAYRCTLSVQEAAEGDEIELVETVENRKWLPIPWLKAEITTSRWLDFAGSQSVVTDKTRFVPSFFMVRGYHRVERRWKVKCLKRGVFGIDKIVLVSTDLLGFVTLSRPVEAQAQITVLPRPADCAVPLTSARYLIGEQIAARRLVEDPFFRCGIREYTARDPMNRISWKATARLQKLMAFENDCTSRENAAVILNIQSRAFENGPVIDSGRAEDAIRLCAAAFEAALRMDVPLRFYANASTRPGRTPIITQEGWGQEYIHGLMRTLSALRLESTDDFGIFLGTLPQDLGAGDVVLITPYLSDTIARFAALQRAFGSTVRVLLAGGGEVPDTLEGLVTVYRGRGEQDA